jgi:hypothetical protein
MEYKGMIGNDFGSIVILFGSIIEKDACMIWMEWDGVVGHITRD